MLRAVRFTASLGFAFDPATRAAVERHATEIIRVSPERIAMEMRRMLSHPTRAEAVELLRDVGLLEAILPEAFAANPDDWAAMMRALKAYGDGDFAVALALVLRFSGVVGGKRVTPRSLQQRWRLSNEETQRMEDALAMESVLLEADKLPWPVVQRQLIRENARGSLGYVQALAETLSTRKEGIQFCLNRLSWPTEKLNPTPLVTGDDLVALGLRPGRHFKAVLDRIRDLQLEGKLTAKEAALDEARRLAEESAA